MNEQTAETIAEPAAEEPKKEPGMIRRIFSYWPWVLGGMALFAGGYATHSYFATPDPDLE